MILHTQVTVLLLCLLEGKGIPQIESDVGELSSRPARAGYQQEHNNNMTSVSYQDFDQPPILKPSSRVVLERHYFV